MNIKELVPDKVGSEINSPDHPTRRFVGFALLLAWHYNLWSYTTRSSALSCSTIA